MIKIVSVLTIIFLCVTSLANQETNSTFRNQYDSEYLLQMAIDRGDVKAVQEALAQISNIDTVRFHEEFTPLQYACLQQRSDVSESDSLQILKLLLPRYTKFNEVGFGGWQGSHVTFADWTPLMLAYAYHAKEFISELEKAGAKITNLNLGLLAAAHNKFPDLVQNFIKQGAKIDYQTYLYDFSGVTPLMFASDENVDILLSSGANPNILDKYGNSALIHYSYLNKNDSNYKNPIALAKLVKAGANINQQNTDGDTALIQAVKNDSPDNVETLLSLGASTDLENKDTWTAFTISACVPADFGSRCKNWNKDEQMKIAKSLIRYHADAGAALLVHTSMYPDSDYTRLLLSSGVDVDVKSKNGETPLIRALETYSNPDVVQILVDHHANVNYRTPYDMSVLDFAVKEDNAYGLAVKKLSILKYAGVHLDAQSPKDGQTSLMFAASWGKYDSVKFLIDAGANLNLKDQSGKTALDWSANSDIRELIKNSGGMSGN